MIEVITTRLFAFASYGFALDEHNNKVRNFCKNHKVKKIVKVKEPSWLDRINPIADFEFETHLFFEV